MSAVRRYGTPAYIASQVQAQQRQRPPRRYSQAELRERRRAGMTVGHYGGDWSLAREIADVVGPLARRVAAADRPARFAHSQASVPWLAEAVHELVSTVVGWLAEADARAKTAHLAAEPGKRRYAITRLCDLAQRPALPEVTDAMLADGSWAAVLTAMAETVDTALSDLLAHAWPPGAAGLRGRDSRSEQLARMLSRTLDPAALELEHRLDRDEQADHRQTTQTADERARAELAALGINT
ncbi:hypothetical protein MXEN_16998 [Mycobacterium xenopi RIVM700367]|uniref:hypothetical protein n=1 Tax=Mycobacterium xenopi TaxID=1789 RepID=UPI00025AE940|nr:hypothetical protein [Mycobacterium xenopi]EID10869.1 hypothetical protein MXEN_16998 [Mycobacterium xenopi RIVM700367]